MLHDSDEDAYVARAAKLGIDPEKARELYRRTGHRPASSTGAIEPALVLQSSPVALIGSGVPQGDLLPTPAPNTQLVPASGARKAVVKRGRPVTEKPPQQQSLQLSMEIDGTPARESGSLGFMASAMVYATLPHSRRVERVYKADGNFRVVDSRFYERKNGPYKVSMASMVSDVGLPFGKIPRLITAYLCTQAIRTREPTIDLGRSRRDFAAKLGMDGNGGDRGGLPRLIDQAQRLFTTAITLTNMPDAVQSFDNLSIADNGLLLFEPHDDTFDGEKRPTLPWNSRIELTPKFFAACIHHSVPLDMRVIHAMRSPLAIDVYIWLTYRFNAIEKPTPISWRQLKWQFGTTDDTDDEQGMRNFIHRFRTCLRSVQTLFPKANIAVDQHKITLYPSTTHVISGPTRQGGNP